MIHRASPQDVIAYGSGRALGRQRGAARNRSMQRGSSGGGAPAAWTPADLGAKVTIWLDERDIVGSPVSDWGDQSAGGTVDFAQAVAGNRPAAGRTLNALTGINCVSNDYLDSAVNSSVVFSVSSAWVDIIFVADSVGATDASVVTSWNTLIGHAGGGYFAIGIQNDGVGGYQCKAYNYDTTADYVKAAAGSYTLGAGGLVRFRHDGGNIYVHGGNGSAESAPVASGNTGSLAFPFRLGSTYTGGTGYDGGIFAVLGGTTQLTAGERASLDAYWAAQFGVSV